MRHEGRRLSTVGWYFRFIVLISLALFLFYPLMIFKSTNACAFFSVSLGIVFAELWDMTER